MQKIAIIGAGGFGREVRDQILSCYPSAIIHFFVDDKWANSEAKGLSQFNSEEYEALIAVGDPKLRREIFERMPKNTKYFTFIHKSAQIFSDVEIGEGSIICPGVILTTNIRVGKHSHLNLLSTIGHDTVVGDFFTTAPGAKISGNVKIGDCVYIGTNAGIREKINICSDSIIGMGSFVVKNIEEPGVYVGSPSKKIK